jgi:dATP pyrophosphohydrolase
MLFSWRAKLKEGMRKRAVNASPRESQEDSLQDARIVGKCGFHALNSPQRAEMRASFQVLVIPFRRTATGLEFAVLKRSDTGWRQFVAGGGEDQEEPIQAARRETKEEIGISGESVFIPLESRNTVPRGNFGAADSWDPNLYVIPEYCFAVDTVDQNIAVSPEHAEFRWVQYERACGMLKWDSNRNALWELSERLKQ